VRAVYCLLFLLASFLTPQSAGAEVVGGSSTFEVVGDGRFVAEENSGPFFVEWTGQAVPSAGQDTVAEIDRITVSSGASSETDDLMFLDTAAPVGEDGSALTYPQTVATYSGQPHSFSFRLQFNPVDFSGVNDFDSGATPFQFAIEFSEREGDHRWRHGLTTWVSVDGVTTDPVPEPSTWAMILVGFASLGLAGYRGRVGRILRLPQSARRDMARQEMARRAESGY
jgi:hypothetical protein